MAEHTRGATYESVGVFLTSDPAVKFYKVECSCGWLGFDVPDAGIAREDWKRHAARKAEQEAA